MEERLIKFAAEIIQVSDSLNKTSAGKHISGQIVRSGTSPALQYGEAQSAESRKDFIHKIKILLKELRETSVGLKIIKLVPLTDKIELISKTSRECHELMAIFNTSIQTAQKNDIKKRNAIK